MANMMFRARTLLGAAAVLTATTLSTAGMAATPTGCFFGVWTINEQLTHRVRPQRALMVFMAPWGDNGWVRVGAIHGPEEQGKQSGEFHFVTWDQKVYPIFGSDPRYTSFKKTDDFSLAASAIREDQPERNGEVSTISFSQDCKRSTWVAQVNDRVNHGTQTLVYDKVLGYTPSANDFYYGAWSLNRPASKLTRAPMAAETIILAPGGPNGWAQVRISGAYQPEDFKKGVKPPADVARPEREMYWATWDGKPAYSTGFDPGRITLKRVDPHHFTIAFDRVHQPWQKGDTGTIVFSNDGKHMTITRSGLNVDGSKFENDTRVYDKIERADWPGNYIIGAAPK